MVPYKDAKVSEEVISLVVRHKIRFHHDDSGALETFTRPSKHATLGALNIEPE